MEIEAALTNHLSNYIALNAIHKGNVCPGIAPQKWKAPYQTFFLISDIPENRRLKVPFQRIQINCFAPTYSQSRLMAKITRDAIDGFSGTMGGAGGVRIANCVYLDAQDFYENDTELYNCQVDIKLIYRI